MSQLPPHLNKVGCDSQRLWPPQWPCFLKIFGLKSSSDLDLPQHSVDLPAHHASPGSPALWTRGLDSVHWTTGWGEKSSSVSKILVLQKPSVTFVLQRCSRFCRFLKLLKTPFVKRHKGARLYVSSRSTGCKQAAPDLPSKLVPYPSSWQKVPCTLNGISEKLL